MKRILTLIAVFALSALLVAGCQNATTLPAQVTAADMEKATLNALQILGNPLDYTIDAEGDSIIYTIGTGPDALVAVWDRVAGTIDLNGKVEGTYMLEDGTPVDATIIFNNIAFLRKPVIEVAEGFEMVYLRNDEVLAEDKFVAFYEADETGRLILPPQMSKMIPAMDLPAGAPLIYEYNTWTDLTFDFYRAYALPGYAEISTTRIPRPDIEMYQAVGGQIAGNVVLDNVEQAYFKTDPDLAVAQHEYFDSNAGEDITIEIDVHKLILTDKLTGEELISMNLDVISFLTGLGELLPGDGDGDDDDDPSGPEY